MFFRQHLAKEAALTSKGEFVSRILSDISRRPAEMERMVAVHLGAA